jgi:hypothetical protein
MFQAGGMVGRLMGRHWYMLVRVVIELFGFIQWTY